MIYIRLKSLPPSSNQAYFNLPKGGRVLTKAGKKYKADVVNHIVKHHATETKELKKNAAIGILVAYGFPDLYSKGFPKKAKNRFTQQDVSNRPKLLHDAIVEATAVDDSQFCYDIAYKFKSEEPETHIYIWNEDERNVGAQLLGAFTQIVGCSGAVQSDGAVSARQESWGQPST